MPIMDGIEATREIRRLEGELNVPPLTPNVGTALAESGHKISLPPLPPDSPTAGCQTIHSAVIIVALTASSLQSDRVSALAAGCNDFLTKPVTNVWLNNKIMEWGSLKALQMYAGSSAQLQKRTGM